MLNQLKKSDSEHTEFRDRLLREHYAGIAMQSLLLLPDGAPWPFGIDPVTENEDESATDCMARAAYMYADAMLRNK